MTTSPLLMRTREALKRRKQHARRQALARAVDLLERVRDGEPFTTRDLDVVIAEGQKAIP